MHKLLAVSSDTRTHDRYRYWLSVNPERGHSFTMVYWKVTSGEWTRGVWEWTWRVSNSQSTIRVSLTDELQRGSTYHDPRT